MIGELERGLSLRDLSPREAGISTKVGVDGRVGIFQVFCQFSYKSISFVNQRENIKIINSKQRRDDIQLKGTREDDKIQMICEIRVLIFDELTVCDEQSDSRVRGFDHKVSVVILVGFGSQIDFQYF